MAPIGIAIVGLGRRTFKKALDVILNDTNWKLVAAVDTEESARKAFQIRCPGIPVFHTVHALLQWNASRVIDNSGTDFEAAYVAVPHYCYAAVIPYLLGAGVDVLKEKPAAINPIELKRFQGLAKVNSVVLMTACQRRYSHTLAQMKESIPRLGNVASIEATYKICVSDAELNEGWRASSALAGGGAMADLGWHLLDTIIGLTGSPTPSEPPDVAFARFFHVRNSDGHDCEDSAEAVLDFPSGMSAHLTVSRIGHKKLEEITITGENGVLAFDGQDVYFHSTATGQKNLDQIASSRGHDRSDVESTFAVFHGHIQDIKNGSPLAARTAQAESISRSSFLPSGRATASAAIANTPKSDHDQPLRIEWPIINTAVEKAVLAQLHEDISIYNNGGIFQTLETEFKVFHNVPNSYALLHNSGTNALQALYFAAGFKPGDEVIFPVYTFHATCSPAMHFGIKPIFCDANLDGNISPFAIAAALTKHTKAIFVTHMWGIPSDMHAIGSLLKEWPQVLLFEDCSHAHGATINGQPVGTFGDGAGWSLQGQKIVTGGEGGITVTKHAEFHYRMLIWGHYNKRCKTEIPADHQLRQFALTGAGVKNRAHPLAVAIALEQLRQLPDFHLRKTQYATQMIIQLARIPFLELPTMVAGKSEPAWYAFVMRFKAEKAPPGLTREVFVDALHAKGLVDVDIPRSTGLLHREPLLTKPWELFPHLYQTDDDIDRSKTFEEAQGFYDEAIKLPVFATAADQAAVDRYVSTILQIAKAWRAEGTHGLASHLQIH
ncbi:MAG: hypothetical protein Q9220_001786 [cf. Caloplaca sp. 1 TL-2023]